MNIEVILTDVPTLNKYPDLLIGMIVKYKFKDEVGEIIGWRFDKNLIAKIKITDEEFWEKVKDLKFPISSKDFTVILKGEEDEI